MVQRILVTITRIVQVGAERWKKSLSCISSHYSLLCGHTCPPHHWSQHSHLQKVIKKIISPKPLTPAIKKKFAKQYTKQKISPLKSKQSYSDVNPILFSEAYAQENMHVWSSRDSGKRAHLIYFTLLTTRKNWLVVSSEALTRTHHVHQEIHQPCSHQMMSNAFAHL